MTGLVSPEWLAERLGDPAVTPIEVSFFPAPRAAWYTGHVPGSRHVYWKDLCWHDTDRRFPTPEVMADRLAALGIGDSSLAVFIGDPIQFGTYAYWVGTMCGFEERVAVLDGGRQTWADLGLPMSTAAPPSPAPVSLTPGIAEDSSRVGRDDVLARLGDPQRVLIDLRSREEFSGERVAPTTAPFDHGAERAGHIPGARHLYHERLLRPDGRFRPADQIEAEFALEQVTSDHEVVTYCRLSHRGSLGWFALTRVAGRSAVRVYDGSWTEWGSMVGMPVER